MKNKYFLCFCLIAAAHFCYYYYTTNTTTNCWGFSYDAGIGTVLEIAQAPRGEGPRRGTESDPPARRPPPALARAALLVPALPLLSPCSPSALSLLPSPALSLPPLCSSHAGAGSAICQLHWIASSCLEALENRYVSSLCFDNLKNERASRSTLRQVVYNIYYIIYIIYNYNTLYYI